MLNPWVPKFQCGMTSSQSKHNYVKKINSFPYVALMYKNQGKGTLVGAMLNHNITEYFDQ